ncbi:hypothetical protein KUTeg_018422 [Tegillarca granosa]|uniref:Long-chain-fatty-acid--CoA ligase n=1 Tax=Tegillarca granosa TaxID=220873 RepID=A0ABQ9EHT8_TEGGR|nr:hypothetical protein KUTeg_018422 [Tegillarca granosa]
MMLIKMVLGIVSAVFGATIAAYFGLKKFAPWIFSDITYIRTVKGANDRFEAQCKNKKFIIDVFEETVKKYAKKTMLIYEDREYSFEYMDNMANQVAQTALNIGLRQGDIVAMFQFNEPSFIWTYLGFQKIGVQIAFINYNLRFKSLLHCIKVSEAKLILIGQGMELKKAILDIQDDLTSFDIYSQDPKPENLPVGFKSFGEAFTKAPSTQPDKSHRSGLRYSTPYVFIYTSGTTGLPKPAIITQLKASRAAYVMTIIGNGNDVLYETLPLYHSAGSMLGVGFCFATGATMVLRSKFSASQFWEDCRKHDVTIIHYVGELCRYLVARPENMQDKVHKVRVAFGNGLRKDVWKEFQSRFNVPQIAEFYAATEMPLGFINVSNKFGSVGRSSPLLRKVVPCEFVKYDYHTQGPIRNEKGRCIACRPGEAGLLIIPLTKIITFEGYKGRKEETNRKLLHNVFKEGDVYINSGDLMYVDDNYDVYFCDRVGDTFRWKGENVSTTEVANVISALDFIHDVTVYGVTVQGCEGRAGMASLCLKEPGCVTLTEEQLRLIWTHCKDLLPSYARPRFIRLQEEMDLTSTFKQRKVALLQEGFDIHKINSTVYMLNEKKSRYSPMDERTYNGILDGTIAL